MPILFLRKFQIAQAAELAHFEQLRELEEAIKRLVAAEEAVEKTRLERLAEDEGEPITRFVVIVNVPSLMQLKAGSAP